MPASAAAEAGGGLPGAHPAIEPVLERPFLYLIDHATRKNL
ncbi:hypothetical protein HMPREF9946_04400 [Acetobacteraceae bacterium AT-5844]|nr:hypothetical protein HMPREF9946_04400 [Acetobacteraceae bacterium AT-5844]